MELIPTKMRKSASVRGGICFIKETASEAKFIFTLQNFGNEDLQLHGRDLCFCIFFSVFGA